MICIQTADQQHDIIAILNNQYVCKYTYIIHVLKSDAPVLFLFLCNVVSEFKRKTLLSSKFKFQTLYVLF